MWCGDQAGAYLGSKLGCLSSSCVPQSSLQLIRKDSESLSRIHMVIYPGPHVSEIVREHKGLTLQLKPQKQLLDSYFTVWQNASSKITGIYFKWIQFLYKGKS